MWRGQRPASSRLGQSARHVHRSIARDSALVPPRFRASPSASQASIAVRANLHSYPKRRPGNSPSPARDRTAAAGTLSSSATSSRVSTSSPTLGVFVTSTRPTERGRATVSRRSRSSLTNDCLRRPVASDRRSRAAACLRGSLTNSGVRSLDMAQMISHAISRYQQLRRRRPVGTWLTVEYMDVDGFLRSPASGDFEDALALTSPAQAGHDVPFRRSGRAERRAWLTRTGRGPSL